VHCPVLFVREEYQIKQFLGLLCVELEKLVWTKVVEYFSTFLMNSYLHFSVEYSGNYGQFESVNALSFGQQFNIA
jgi:hypothetical protein